MAAIQPPLFHWLIAGALAAGSAAALRYGFRAWRESRLIEDTPTSRIRSAAQGYVEFSGRSRVPADARIQGPLTGISCAWWRYQVEERRSSGRSRSWVRINGGASEAPFLVDDGTAQCLVDPRGAQVFPHTSDVWYGPDPWPEVRIPAGTGLFGRLVDSLLGGGYRYTEHRLSPDAPLLAIGEFRMQGGSFAQDPEQQTAALLHDWKNDQAALLARFDANHDGVLSARRVGSRARRRAPPGAGRRDLEARRPRRASARGARRRPRVPAGRGRRPIARVEIQGARARRRRRVRRCGGRVRVGVARHLIESNG